MPTRPVLLVVDDDAAILQLVADVLQPTYTVHLASDVLEAADELRRLSFDLLIVDLSLPVLGGVELIELLQASAAFLPVPILVISAFPELVARVEHLARVRSLPKPFSIGDLQQRVAEMLGR